MKPKSCINCLDPQGKKCLRMKTVHQKVEGPKEVSERGIRWLTSSETLEMHAHLSIEERCVEYERKFEGKRMNPY